MDCILLVGRAANSRTQILGKVLRRFHREWAADSLELRKEPEGPMVDWNDALNIDLRTNLHRVQLGVWRFSLRQLNRRNAQAPYIGFMIITTLLYHFW